MMNKLVMISICIFGSSTKIFKSVIINHNYNCIQCNTSIYLSHYSTCKIIPNQILRDFPLAFIIIYAFAETIFNLFALASTYV